jgi:hypothetical protein
VFGRFKTMNEVITVYVSDEVKIPIQRQQILPI